MKLILDSYSSSLEEKLIWLCGRFQILRGLIPQNDQKRDKASFLLEVRLIIVLFTYQTVEGCSDHCHSSSECFFVMIEEVLY